MGVAPAYRGQSFRSGRSEPNMPRLVLGLTSGFVKTRCVVNTRC